MPMSRQDPIKVCCHFTTCYLRERRAVAVCCFLETCVGGGSIPVVSAGSASGSATTPQFLQVEIAEATPTNLRRAVGAGGHLPAIVRWGRSQPPGSAPLPWHAETIPAATPVPPGANGTIAFATTAPPAARFEGLTQTTTRVNATESAFTEIARAQARTAGSILQLTSSAAALVQHAGLTNALPPTPPAFLLRTFAAIAGAPAPAGAAAVASGSDAAVDVTAAGVAAPAEAPAAGPSWHGLMSSASTDGSTHVGASPSAEVDLYDDSMPVPDEVPVSRSTRLSLALASMLPPAPGTAQGTADGAAHLGGHDPACPFRGRARVGRRVRRGHERRARRL